MEGHETVLVCSWLALWRCDVVQGGDRAVNLDQAPRGVLMQLAQIVPARVEDAFERRAKVLKRTFD